MSTASILGALSEGSVFQTPPLLPALSGEPIVWNILEKAKIGDKVTRLTVHGYYDGVFIGSASIKLEANKEPQWSFAA